MAERKLPKLQAGVRFPSSAQPSLAGHDLRGDGGIVGGSGVVWPVPGNYPSERQIPKLLPCGSRRWATPIPSPIFVGGTATHLPTRSPCSSRTCGSGTEA